MKPIPITGQPHPAILVSADVRIMHLPAGPCCQKCLLRGKRDHWLTGAQIEAHITQHTAAGHRTGQ